MPQPTKKPYRRFRAHGRPGADLSQELNALRELNEAAPRERVRRTEPPAPPPKPVTAVPARRRRWWSLRGVSKGGLVARFGGLVVLTVLVWAGLGYLALRSAAAEANEGVSPRARAALADPNGGLLGTPQNILIIGSDADRDRTGARADTVLIMRTDPDAGRIKYLSIPRDLRVDVPGVGPVKITEAFAYRGNRGVIRAIRDEVGLPIHHIMVIDFNGVSRMVDAVGGVEVDNPFDLRDCPYPGGKTVTFPRGKLALDGPTALEYVRVRSCDSDIERARRQQLVVAALKSQVVSWSALPVAPWRGARIIRSMHTDLSATELAKLGWLQGRLTTEPKDRDVLAGTPETVGGKSYILVDPTRAEEQIRRFQSPS
jgi:LCP family protein required for cell wall assembly